MSLNPFCFGIWGLRKELKEVIKRLKKVLILFVLEYGVWATISFANYEESLRLNPFCFGIWGLRTYAFNGSTILCGLNPFCFGIWGLRATNNVATEVIASVLILFVLEYGVWVIKEFTLEETIECLNPFCFGIWGLRDVKKYEDEFNACLNPFCFGIWGLSNYEKDSNQTGCLSLL